MLTASLASAESQSAAILSRRSLLVGAAVAVPVAATGMGVGAAFGQDTALIEAFGRWIDLRRHMEAIPADGDDALEAASLDEESLFAEIAEIPAATLMGLAIKAYIEALCRSGGCASAPLHPSLPDAFEDDDAGEMPGRVRASLVADLIRVLGIPTHPEMIRQGALS